jgi:hypothetical protein
MKQLNLQLTPEFEEELAEYMRLRRVRTKSDAVRLAVREAVARERRQPMNSDFSKWLGLGVRVPENPEPKFKSDDDLWN